MLQQNFVDRLLKFNGDVLLNAPHLCEFLVSEYFGEGKGRCERLTFGRVRRANAAAAALFRWCNNQLRVALPATFDELDQEEQVEAGVGDVASSQARDPDEQSEGNCHPAVEEGSLVGKEEEAPSSLDEEVKSNDELEVETFEVLTDLGWKEDALLSLRVRAAGGLENCDSTFEYSARGWTYSVDLTGMEQMNSLTGKVRPIRLPRIS